MRTPSKEPALEHYVDTSPETCDPLMGASDSEAITWESLAAM